MTMKLAGVEGEVTFQAILWRKCHPEVWAMRVSIMEQLPPGLSATLLRKNCHTRAKRCPSSCAWSRAL